MKKILILMIAILIPAILFGCADKVAEMGTDTGDSFTESVPDFSEKRNSFSESVNTTTGLLPEGHEEKKKDTLDVEYILDLFDRVEEDYRYCGEISKELGISPNEDFLNRRFDNVSPLDILIIHDSIARLTLKYLENEIDESLFWERPYDADAEVLEAEMVKCIFRNKSDKELCESICDKDNWYDCCKLFKEKTGFFVGVYVGTFYYDDARGNCAVGSNSKINPYKNRIVNHTIEIDCNPDSEDNKDYFKHIIRSDRKCYDDFTPIELRFLYDDMLLYKHCYKQEYCGFMACYSFFSFNFYPDLLKNYLLRDVFRAPDENGRYDFSVRTPIKSFNFSERYPEE